MDSLRPMCHDQEIVKCAHSLCQNPEFQKGFLTLRKEEYHNLNNTKEKDINYNLEDTQEYLEKPEGSARRLLKAKCRGKRGYNRGYHCKYGFWVLGWRFGYGCITETEASIGRGVRDIVYHPRYSGVFLLDDDERSSVE
jgi:hypothetical protein